MIKSNTMLRNFLAVLCSLLSLSLIAQNDTSKKGTTIISGFADAYYRYSIPDAAGNFNNYTSFTNSQNSFELGMLSVKAEHNIGKVSATADIGFGKKAQEFSYNDAGSLTTLKQLYVSYAPSSTIKFTMGKWATHVGYEVVDATGNRNYSMSYGFSYGPFFHTGIKAELALGGKTALMLGVADPTDFTGTISPVKFVLAQLSSASKNDQIKAYVNFQAGGGITHFNLVTTATISSTLSVAYDGSIQSAKFSDAISNWESHALYLNYDPSNQFGFTLRQDFFNDRKINSLNIGGKIYATTLSANIKVYKLTIIPEIRMENANQLAFSKGNGNFTNNACSFILAAVYKL